MENARADAWANASSVHGKGRAARALVEAARAQIAKAISAAPADIVLTSGGTEACNLGVRGLSAPRGGHAVTTAVEHPAVLGALSCLARDAGVSITRLSVPEGRAPDPEAIASALRSDTRICALQWVNHETGTLFPAASYAEVCRSKGVPLFIDATQAAGKVAIDVNALGCDLLALASHKLGGPAGAGALWVKRGRAISALIAGGGQERGRRAGTGDVHSVVGFGAACAVLHERLAAMPRIAALRDACEAVLLRMGAVRNGAAGERVATVTNVSFANWRAETLVAALDLEGVCAASGAACSSGLQEPSPVLLAMYEAEPWRASTALRLSFGPETNSTEVDGALSAMARVLNRKGSP